MAMNFRRSILLTFTLLGLAGCASPASSTATGLHYFSPSPDMKVATDAAFQAHYAFPRPAFDPQLPAKSELDIGPLISRYTLSPDDVLSGRGLQSPKLKQFRSFIKSSNKIVGELDLYPESDGKVDSHSAQIETINAIWLTALGTIVEGLANVETLEQVRKGSYELRLLILPAHDTALGGRLIQGEVMWLKSTTPDSDLIYTFPKSKSPAVDDPPGLQPSTVYTVPEMLNAIRPAIEAFQAKGAAKVK